MYFSEIYSTSLGLVIGHFIHFNIYTSLYHVLCIFPFIYMIPLDVLCWAGKTSNPCLLS